MRNTACTKITVPKSVSFTYKVQNNVYENFHIFLSELNTVIHSFGVITVKITIFCLLGSITFVSGLLLLCTWRL